LPPFVSGLKGSVADPDPGSGIGCLFDPGIRDGRKSASGSGIRDEQPGSYFLELRNHFFVFLGLKYLNSLMRIRDPGWKKFGSGIRDKHPGSATLLKGIGFLFAVWKRGLDTACKIEKICENKRVLHAAIRYLLSPCKRVSDCL
jgi:hypothetical protein